MIRLLLSVTAGAGAALIVLDRLSPPASRPARPAVVRPSIPAVAVSVGLAGTVWLLLGSTLVALVAAGAGLLAPRMLAARERRRRNEELSEAWPRLLDEARVLCGPGGLSLAQALFTAGRSSSSELREAWADAERAWTLSADLSAALRRVQEQLGDPTTAIVCPTLDVLHDAGGSAQHEQLTRLVEDRRRDAAARRSAEAELAGARFSRRFVVIVPVGMALAGQSVGTGRSAFSTPAGQFAALAAVAVTAACWYWSGRLLAVPTLAGAPS